MNRSNKNISGKRPVYGDTVTTAYVVVCALLALLLAAAALFLEQPALRTAAVMLCMSLLALCMTMGVRRKLRRETDRYRSDCTRLRESETLLRKKSELDPLTQTLNRRAFSEHAEAYLTDAGVSHAFLMLDLDGFKQVNDTCGHDTGDRTLVEVADSIRGALRPQDLLCRIGGDEFAVLLLHVPDDALVERRARGICDAVRRTVCGRVPLSASIGAAVYPRDGRALDVLYARADKGLYRSKHSGKDGFSFYDGDA